MARFILNTIYTGGDLVPFVRMGRALRRRGHDVTLVTHGDSAAIARNAGFAFEAVDERGALDALLSDSASLHDPRKAEAYYKKHILSRAVREFEAIGRHAGRDAVVVGRSNTSVGARFAAEAHGMPFVSTYLSPAFASGLRVTVPLLESLADDIAAARAACGLDGALDLGPWLRGAGGVGLWPAWFKDDDGTWPSDLRLIGFLTGTKTGKPLDPALAEALASHPILVTGGSASYMTREFFASALDGCEQLGKRVILVAPDRSLLPRRLPPSVVCIDFIEFADVFPLVSVVVHHGGIATCGEALSAGVPQLVMGAWFDRPDNGAHLERLGVGEYLPPARADGDSVAAALKRLVESPMCHERCRALAARVRAEDPEATLCSFLLDLVAKRPAAAASAPRRPQARNERRADRANAIKAKLDALSPAKRDLVALTLRQLGARSESSDLVHVARTDPAPLSYEQELFWEFERRHPGSPNFSAAWARKVTGRLDRDVFVAAIAELFARHEILRTSIDVVDGTPVQVVRDSPPDLVEVHDVSAEDDPKQAAESWLAARWRTPVDLTRPPRPSLLVLGPTEHIVVLEAPKVFMDGIVVDVAFNEIVALYAARTSGAAPPPPPELQYADYAIWQRERVATPAFAKRIEEARRAIRGAKPIALPYDRPDPAVRTPDPLTAKVMVSDDTWTRWKAVATAESTTPYVVHAALWSAFHAMETGTNDVLLISPVSLRFASQRLGRMLGTLQNYSVFRIDLAGTSSLRDIVRRARAAAARAQANADLPVQLLLDDIPWDSRLGRCAFNAFGAGAAITQRDERGGSPELVLSETGVNYLPRHTDLTWITFGQTQQLLAAADRFDPSTVDALAGRLSQFVSDVLASPETLPRGLAEAVGKKSATPFTMEFDHVGCAVSNIDEVLRGLQPMPVSDVRQVGFLPHLDVRIAMVNLAGLPLELVQPNASHPTAQLLKTKQTQLYHVCFRVSSIEQGIDKLTSEGFVLIERWEQPDGKYSYLMTQHGLPVELYEPTPEGL